MSGTCVHCHSPLPQAPVADVYCCTGCQAVASLLSAEGLSRYYDLAGGAARPAPVASSSSNLAWLAPLLESAENRGPLCSLELDVQGLHCAACVWLINELFRREAGGARIVVNSALGKVQLSWHRGAFGLAKFVTRVESFGYRFGPSRKSTVLASNDLLLRLGVCAAIAINVMLFSVAVYSGLDAKDPLFPLFAHLALGLTAASVAVGGWPFFKSALSSLRLRALHLDVPIALGIVLVFGVTLLRLNGGAADFAYLDTLNVFITLMLTGRWLSAHWVDRNRSFLLQDEGAEGLWARRVEGKTVASVAANRLKEGDVVLVAPGELALVDGRLLDEGEASFSTEWLCGEARPTMSRQGDLIEAGSFNASNRAVHLSATSDFSSTRLSSLLRSSPDTRSAKSQHGAFFDALARRWVVTVLSLSALGFLLWLPSGIDSALDVAVALCVVTCPCAIGIAIPLAYELTHASLRRQGFFARRLDALDRLAQVRTLIFDKTGTLTLGRLELNLPESLFALSHEARDIAYSLSQRSSHPVSQVIGRQLALHRANYRADLVAHETAGKGLSCTVSGALWKLGRGDWAAAGASNRETVLSRDGRLVHAFPVHETLRADATAQLARLRADGYSMHLLSGDRAESVASLAARLEFPPSCAHGELSPEAKAQAVDALDRGDTLYLGDGVNDALAFEKATCSGTPAADRPVVPGKSDFFLTTEGLSPLRVALVEAQNLRATVRALVQLSTAYNLLVVVAGLAGLLTPVRAAIAMPLSTAALLTFTLWRLKPARSTQSTALVSTLQRADA